MLRPSARRLLVVLALASPALAVMLAGLGAPPHGEHVFRQTHVAANVEKFLEHGPSLRPQAYNQDVPGALFDFPVYSWLAAALSRLAGSPPVATARALNVLVFLATLLALDALWRRSGAGRAQRLCGLLVFAYAPLDLFYFQVPLPDPLALLLALLSLGAYVTWDDARDARTRRRALLALVAAGTLSALIKNPLYLPYAIAIACDRLRRRGPRGLLAAGFVAFALALGAAVVGFKLYSNHVNGTAAFLEPGEGAAYFGALGERLRPRHWRALLEAVTTRVASPPVLALAALGLVAYAVRARAMRRGLHLGLAAGVVVTLLVFFNRHREHAYYQLPFEPAIAFFAAYPPALAAAWLRRRVRQRRALTGLKMALVAPLAILLVLHGLRTLKEMQANWDPGVADRGAWLAAHTDPRDFVVFVLGWREDNWEPSHLYFASRDGYNLARSAVTYARLAELQRRYAARYRRFLVYAPTFALPDVQERLTKLGAKLLAEDDRQGRLYQLEPAWLRPFD